MQSPPGVWQTRAALVGSSDSKYENRCRPLQKPIMQSRSGPTPELNPNEFSLEVLYYGGCHGLVTEDGGLSLNTLRRQLDQRSDQAQAVVHSKLIFSEDGVALSGWKSEYRITEWYIKAIVSCVTMVEPGCPTHRLGLLKIDDNATNEPTWHLFRYPSGDVDNFADAFRAVSHAPITTQHRDPAHTQRDPSGQELSAAPKCSNPADSSPTALDSDLDLALSRTPVGCWARLGPRKLLRSLSNN